MFVKRFYEPAVAQASYLIGCQRTGEALVIDATRDVDQYVNTAQQEGLRITQVTETHIHADYVSGSRELAHRTGASLCLSDEGDADWKYQFPHQRRLKDGDRITIGNVAVDVMHTPGHTPEHLTFLVTDAGADKPIAAVTGDFMFVGDVGRPDLLERAANMAGTMEKGARVLWASLQKFAQLDEWLQLWPGHGAGSACGKGISSIPSSTLGYERRFNWAFACKTEQEFVDKVLAGQPEPPKYFAVMKQVNKQGPAIIGGTPMPPAIDSIDARSSVVIDTRPAEEFGRGHLPGALNIPFSGSFVTWAGWLIPYDRDFYVISDSPDQVRRALALIGLDRIAGFLPTSAAAGDVTVPQVSASELVSSDDITVIDVRSANEWAAGHIPGAIHIPLGYLSDRVADIPAGRRIVVQCQSGARSAIATSVLQRAGLTNVFNLTGGFNSWTQHAAKTTHA